MCVCVYVCACVYLCVNEYFDKMCNMIYSLLHFSSICY